MPTDPSIPLAVKLPDIATPQQVQAQGLAIQGKRLDIQEQQQKIADEARARGEQDAINRLYVSSADPTTGKVDQQQFLGALAANGLGTKVPVYQKSFDDANKSAADSAKAQADAKEAQTKADLDEADLFANIGARAQANGYDPVQLHIDMDAAQKAGHDTAPFEAALQQGIPLKQVVDTMVQGSAKQRELLQKQAEIDKPVSVAGVGLVNPKTGEVIAASPQPTESKSMLVDGKPSEVVFDPRAKTYSVGSEVIDPSRLKPIPPASMTINPATVPSGDALTMAAKNYLATGTLPPMGMGQAGVAARIAIMNEAAKIDPNASLAANKAVYHADTGNLANLQKTEGTLSAFESTANKNLDQYVTAYQKLADTGSPLLNRPIRTLQGSALGDPNVAAANAAASVALREIARVTNDPKLSGALTDSARQEVTGLVPAGATLQQLASVVKVLRADMGNVHSSIKDQIASVKAGIDANPNKPATDAAAQTTTQPSAQDLDGLKQGMKRTFRTGPLAGQTWTLGPDGKPVKL